MPELPERAKVILRVIALFVVAGAIGTGLYFLFFASKPSVIETPDETPSTGNGGSLPSSPDAENGGNTGGGTETPGDSGTGSLPSSPVADGGPTTNYILTTSAVVAPTVTGSGTVAYYDPGDGHFYTIDRNGSAKLLSDASFAEAESVTFSDSADEAVIEFPDGSNVAYNFNTGKQVSMPSHWEDFAFSGDGTSIATKSVAADPSARALVITSADGSTTKVVAALGSNQNLVDANMSPDGSVVAFSKTGDSGSAFGQQEIYMIDQEGNASGVLLVNGSNFTARWSPDSGHILYSVADASDDYRATLWYADKDGDRKTGTRQAVGLRTSADKCTFASNTTVYCAAPKEMPADGGASPSLITANDDVYRIDLNTLRVTLVATPSVATRMSNLSVGQNGSTLYYTDKSGRLNYLRLK